MEQALTVVEQKEVQFYGTPGHMKGYTFGTSDFVKADIQPRAVPAT